MNPNISNARIVTIIDATTASLATGTIMYGESGINPPMMYDMAIVSALCNALIGSGFSSPNSNLHHRFFLIEDLENRIFRRNGLKKKEEKVYFIMKLSQC